MHGTCNMHRQIGEQPFVPILSQLRHPIARLNALLGEPACYPQHIAADISPRS
jgi:hypothetical protein